ncbi:trypsin, alkaline B-like [Vanessa cardui]|uniref:trypsin, alkaline B-like n=1 Tax=Vanessa cardui TaxID=171605 RepID=UPI001F12AE80|nr:trypsin, alkaline B-like [Vanessa cardui]
MNYLIIFSLICVFSTSNANPTRISGGSVADIKEYPFAVSLLSSSGTINFSQLCGGTIITRSAILSAASCFVSNYVYLTPNRVDSELWWRARVGSSYFDRQGQVYLIRRITIHPGFKSATRAHDIAVLRTTGNIAFGLSVQAANIAGESYLVATNQPVMAVGWGVTSVLSPYSPRLRQVEIWVNDQQTCANRYRGVFGVTTNMICAGLLDTGVRGQCQGDTGSPLLHNGVVVGVYSWTPGCGTDYYPNINTRVSAYSRWIVSTTSIA